MSEQVSPVPEPVFRLKGTYRATLKIEFATATDDRAEMEIAEYWSDDLRDLALLITINGKTLMILPEGQETPWFFDRTQLKQSIEKHGAWQTFMDILDYLIHPVVEIKKGVGGG
jgi:hypothetical protein